MNLENANPALFAAIAAAQAEVENATKSSSNPYFGSRYADLAEVLNTVRPTFAKHGVAIIQSVSADGQLVTVCTTLGHKDGGFVTSSLSCTAPSLKAQDLGSITTYLRRYSIAAMCSISQADDDGNSASQLKAAPPAQKPTRTAAVAFEEIEQLRYRMATLDVEEQKFLKHLGIKSLADLDADRLKKAHIALDKKASKLTDGIAATVQTQEAA